VTIVQTGVAEWRIKIGRRFIGHPWKQNGDYKHWAILFYNRGGTKAGQAPLMLVEVIKKNHHDRVHVLLKSLWKNGRVPKYIHVTVNKPIQWNTERYLVEHGPVICQDYQI
jgi:hypothetical protein